MKTKTYANKEPRGDDTISYVLNPRTHTMASEWRRRAPRGLRPHKPPPDRPSLEANFSSPRAVPVPPSQPTCRLLNRTGPRKRRRWTCGARAAWCSRCSPAPRPSAAASTPSAPASEPPPPPLGSPRGGGLAYRTAPACYWLTALLIPVPASVCPPLPS